MAAAVLWATLFDEAERNAASHANAAPVPSAENSEWALASRRRRLGY